MPPVTEASYGLFPAHDLESFAPDAMAAGVPHYFILPHAQALADILKSNARMFIELGSRGTLTRDLKKLQERQPDFGLCLTTRHTYNSQVAGIITQALNDRFGMSRLKKMPIMTCLQEGLANAVVHGNLCIECPRDSLEGFEKYYSMIDEAVSSDTFKDKRIYVRAWEHVYSFQICITHEGDGVLNPAYFSKHNPLPSQKCGRGLFIIQSLAEQVTTDAECKTLDITFSY